jgi:aspartyl protease family protein
MIMRHAAILASAVLSAVAAARGLEAFSPTRAAASPATASEKPLAAASDAAGEAAPSAQAPESQAAEVDKGADGHYWAQANVDGRWVRFLVDTGATTVALTMTDAQRVGLDTSALVYDRPVMTANGATKAAQVRLDHVTVAGARVDDVDALVVKDGMPASLLGMSYLGRLSRFEATRTALILRP